jgi:hypothetical protein
VTRTRNRREKTIALVVAYNLRDLIYLPCCHSLTSDDSSGAGKAADSHKEDSM